MLIGQLLFLAAALSIGFGTVLGVLTLLVRVVAFKARGRDLAPQPEPGSVEWAGVDRGSIVDTSAPSLINEQRGRTTKDPVVNLAGVRYRVTRLGATRFLVTRASDGTRVGTFELDGEGRYQQVLPEPDDPAQAKLIVQIAVLSSLVRSNAA